MGVSVRIREYCERKNLHRADLYGKIAVKATVDKIWENKQEPRVKPIEAFLNLFKDVDARWLMTGEEKESCDRINLLMEDKAQYGFSREIIKLETKIEFLEKLITTQENALKDKDGKIEELLLKIGEMRGGAVGQVNNSQAS